MHILFVFKEMQDINLGAMYLSSALKRRGHRVEAVPADIMFLKKRLKGARPAILAYSTIAFYADFYLDFNKQIKKESSVFSIFGGAYPTAMPDMVQEDGVDAVCLGEGEDAFVELADNLEAGRDYSHIKNLWVKTGDHVEKNDVRPLVEDLDIIPFPDRELFWQRSPFYYDRLNMITSRGCAYACPYCFNNTLSRIYGERRYRRRSVENVLQEILSVLSRQEVRFILFHDDIFVLRPTWLEEFAYKYQRRIGIPFSCYVRIDLITNEIASYLKKAGCHSVCFGIESGDDKIRNGIFRRNMKREDIVSASGLLKQYGIRMRTTNILGIPGGSLESDIKTLDLNVECKIDYAHVTTLASYPNTEIGSFVRDINVESKWPQYTEGSLPYAVNLLKIYSSSAVSYFQRLVYSLTGPRHGYADLREKLQITNLQNIFAMIVAFPFFRPMLSFFLRAPCTKFFVYVNFFLRHFCCYFIIYPTGFLSFLRGLSRRKKDLSEAAHPLSQH